MRSAWHHWVWFPLVAVLLGASVWAAFGPVGSDSREQVYVIPQGTWARRSAGEKLEVLPSEIRLTLGIKDILVMKNQDDVPQMFGPVLIMPGQSFRLPFRVASSNQFACTAHVSGTLTVNVEPAPAPGWERIRWRVGTILQSTG